MSRDIENIAKLNDAWRINGPMMITSGIQALGAEFVQKASHTVRTYADFNPDNDPYGERDFGSFELEGHKLFWKIDYYAKPETGEKPYTMGSEDPADLSKTDRVTTVMLAEEYCDFALDQGRALLYTIVSRSILGLPVASVQSIKNCHFAIRKCTM